MGAPQPEIDKQGVRGRDYATRGLARDQHLKLQQIDDAGLDELRLGDRGDDLQYRLVREEYGAFRHCPHIAGEPEGCEGVDKRREELLADSQPVELTGGAARRFEEREDLLETRCDQISPPRREVADEELEHGRFVHAGVPVALQIEIGQQQIRERSITWIFTHGDTVVPPVSPTAHRAVRRATRPVRP